jgi:hypothetical protein
MLIQSSIAARELSIIFEVSAHACDQLYSSTLPVLTCWYFTHAAGISTLQLHDGVFGDLSDTEEDKELNNRSDQVNICTLISCTTILHAIAAQLLHSARSGVIRVEVVQRTLKQSVSLCSIPRTHTQCCTMHIYSYACRHCTAYSLSISSIQLTAMSCMRDNSSSISVHCVMLTHSVRLPMQMLLYKSNTNSMFYSCCSCCSVVREKTPQPVQTAAAPLDTLR